MTFQIGDQIVHRNYGPAKIIDIEKKGIAGKTRQYYVVKTTDVTVWVPVDATENSIRFPISQEEFQDLLALLQGDGERLPEHHVERQGVLLLRMKTRTFPELCSIIRDLTLRGRSHTLTRNDNEMMKRAVDYLLNEWELVLGTPRSVARQELAGLLQAGPTILAALGA
jgi:RNA polymerase-interacting CarD/CdnL/TRCF family regulator